MIFCCTTLLNFNFYMLLCEINALKQKTNPWPAMYMYFYTTQQNMFTCKRIAVFVIKQK
jgi:hypothetical protein